MAGHSDAAKGGVVAAGATEVLVNDPHGGQRNPRLEYLELVKRLVGHRRAAGVGPNDAVRSDWSPDSSRENRRANVSAIDIAGQRRISSPCAKIFALRPCTRSPGPT
jgi:hypothetical protein